MKATVAGLVVRPADGSVDGPVVLSGPPRSLRGRLRLVNDGPDRVAVRGFAARAENVEAVAARGTILARLGPGDTSDVRAGVTVAGSTPPGTYPAVLEIGGLQVDAVLRVSADMAAAVSPSMVLAPPGSTRLRLEVSNLGNVAFEVADVSRARLVEDAEATPPLLPGERSAHGTPTDLDAVLILTKALSLAPGAKAEIAARVEIPDGLDGERRYVAQVPVSTATLRVVVVPRPTPPKPRAKATTRRSDA